MGKLWGDVVGEWEDGARQWCRESQWRSAVLCSLATQDADGLEADSREPWVAGSGAERVTQKAATTAPTQEYRLLSKQHLLSGDLVGLQPQSTLIPEHTYASANNLQLASEGRGQAWGHRARYQELIAYMTDRHADTGTDSPDSL